MVITFLRLRPMWSNSRYNEPATERGRICDAGLIAPFNPLVRPFMSRVTRLIHLIHVHLAAIAEILLEAFTAPPLVTILVSIERLEWERSFAALASPLHEHMFVAEADGISA